MRRGNAELQTTTTRQGTEPRWAVWACLYALLVVYASTVISPLGVNFVPQDPEAAWRKFRSIGMGSLSSDQRADWMGNLGMLVPLGFCAAGALAGAAGGIARRLLGGAAALACCILFVVAVKYLQLFFPPRTVNLAYIIAQSLGAALGVALYVAGHGVLRRAWAEITRASHRGLIALLAAYALAVLVFMLAPFDVVVSSDDLADRLASLPASLSALPGAGRPAYQRLAILAGNVGLLAPVGALLQLLRPADSLGRVALHGALLLAAATLASMFILSASPSLVAAGLRLVGLVAGAAAIRMLARLDARSWRHRLGWLALLAIPPYLLVLAAANGLARAEWEGPEAMVTLLQSDPRLLLPLWTHYIVSKAQAIKSVGVHLVMYAPVGVVVWARHGGGRLRMAQAGLLGFGLALAVELGRGMGPRLPPDFNNAVIGAFAAAAAVPLARVAWSMLESLPGAMAAGRGYRRRG